jgi:hypothetical protein
MCKNKLSRVVAVVNKKEMYVKKVALKFVFGHINPRHRNLALVLIFIWASVVGRRFFKYPSNAKFVVGNSKTT